MSELLTKFDPERAILDVSDMAKQTLILAHEARDKMKLALHSAAKVGAIMCRIKESIGYGNWEKCIAENWPMLSRETCWRWMVLSRNIALCDKCMSKSEAYRLLGLSSGEKPKPKILGTSPLVIPEAFINTAKSVLRKPRALFEGVDLSQWAEDKRNELKEELKPIVEVYESL